MSFYEYMLSKYLNDDSAEGDLAGDMKHEQATFPRCGTDGYQTLRRYLFAHHACLECMAVFEHCWKEYVRHERKKH